MQPYRGYIPKPIFRLMALAETIRSDDRLKDWLWRHTRSPEHYDAIIDALKFLANPGFVEWEEVEEAEIHG